MSEPDVPVDEADKKGVWIPLAIMEVAPTAQAAILLAELAWLQQPSYYGTDRTVFVERHDSRWMVTTDEDLGARTGLSRTGAYRARGQLKKAKLIEVRVGKVDGIKRCLVRLTLPDSVSLESAEARNSRRAEARNSQKRGSAQSFPSSDLGNKTHRASTPKPPTAPEDVRNLCEHLAKRIAGHNEKPLLAWDSTRWLTDMRLLLERGPTDRAAPETLSADHVQRSIDAIFDSLVVPSRDGFCWADVIRSPAALRSKWDKLGEAYKRTKPTEEAVPEWMA